MEFVNMMMMSNLSDETSRSLSIGGTSAALMAMNSSSTNMSIEIDNDYLQHQIYNEVRRNNSNLETWHHVFGVFGSLISVFGIIGNLLSIIILVKPASSNEKYIKCLNERNQHQKRVLGSFEHKLASFYAYLTALSFCDLFSCIFAILNMLEYIPPPYMELNLTKYREFCLSISLYTHPIATTLQALSVWIICAFSIHRCRSIIKPSNFLTSIKNRTNADDATVAAAADEHNNRGLMYKLFHRRRKSPGLKKSVSHVSSVQTSAHSSCENELSPQQDGHVNSHSDSKKNYFFHVNLKNNFNHQTYQLKFYTKSFNLKFVPDFCVYCFCKCSPNVKKTPYDIMKTKDTVHESRSDVNDSVTFTNSDNQPSSNGYNHNHNTPKIVINKTKSQTTAKPASKSPVNKLNKARLTILILYLVALIYLLPQMFEKKLSYMEIQHKTYVFTTITRFGRNRLFRQIFHLWFYLLAIYILPFMLIFIFNLLLLRTYLISKKRCQRYKLRADPNKILRDYNSFASNGFGNDEVGKQMNTSATTTNFLNNQNNSTGGKTVVKTTSFLSVNENALAKMTQNHSIISETQSMLNFQKIQQNFNRRRSSTRTTATTARLNRKGRALTLTLFGVVAIFFICHFPAAVAKIIHVLFPSLEFEKKSAFASICLDLSNFLIMVNSSINFLLYIVFGPGKFRQEFTVLFFSLFPCIPRRNARRRQCSFDDSFRRTSNCGAGNGSDLRSKKCSFSNSEYNFNPHANYNATSSGRYTNSIFESSAEHRHENSTLVEEDNV